METIENFHEAEPLRLGKISFSIGNSEEKLNRALLSPLCSEEVKLVFEYPMRARNENVVVNYGQQASGSFGVVIVIILFDTTTLHLVRN